MGAVGKEMAGKPYFDAHMKVFVALAPGLMHWDANELQAAVDLLETIPFNPNDPSLAVGVTPWEAFVAKVQATEGAEESLLEAALSAYQSSIARYGNRRVSVLGIIDIAGKLGNKKLVQEYEEILAGEQMQAPEQ